MHNHESRKIHHILRSMHYINIHNSTVTGTTNRTNSPLQAATNNTINPIRIIFSELSPLKYNFHVTIRFTVNYINSCLKLGNLRHI